MLIVFSFGIISPVGMTVIRSSNNSVGINRLVNDDKKECDDDNDESDDDIDNGCIIKIIVIYFMWMYGIKGGVHGDAVMVDGNNWYGAGLDNAEVNDIINFVC